MPSTSKLISGILLFSDSPDLIYSILDSDICASKLLSVSVSSTGTEAFIFSNENGVSSTKPKDKDFFSEFRV